MASIICERMLYLIGVPYLPFRNCFTMALSWVFFQKLIISESTQIRISSMRNIKRASINHSFIVFIKVKEKTYIHSMVSFFEFLTNFFSRSNNNKCILEFYNTKLDRTDSNLNNLRSDLLLNLNRLIYSSIIRSTFNCKM